MAQDNALFYHLTTDANVQEWLL